MAATRIFTDEVLAWMEQHIEGTSHDRLTEMLNERFGLSLTIKQVSGFIYRKGLSNERRNKIHFYTEEQRQWLRTHASGHGYAELTELFNSQFGANVSWRAIRSTCQRFGCPNGRKGMDESVRKNMFSQGCVPWNKGTRGICKANKGSFQEGHHSPRQHPVGSLSFRHRKTWLVKTAEPNVWRRASHVIYESATGQTLAPGAVVIHADGDKNNLAPENLVALTKGELTSLRMNNLRVPDDADMTKCGVALVKLRDAVKRKKEDSRC